MNLSSDQGQGGRPDFAARNLTCEIAAHQLIFGLVLLPLNLILVPMFALQGMTGFLQSWATPIAGNAVPALSAVVEPWFATSATLILFLAVATSGIVRVRRRSLCEAAQSRRQYLEMDREHGRQLRELVESYWRDTLSRQLPAPDLRWFPNLNVLARALDVSGVRVIAVSAGLWERFLHRQDDPIVHLVLLHEMAHHAYRDIAGFRLIDLCARVSRIILYSLFWAGMGIASAFALAELAASFGSDLSFWAYGGRVTTVLALSGLHYGTLPLTSMLLRRYLGFITALMELRADVVASAQLGGLGKAGQTMAADPTIRQSGIVDLGRSLVSLNLSHLPESERGGLLRNTERLLTPKLRYFGLSIILSVIQPLNGAIFSHFPKQLALLSMGAIGTAQMVAAVVMISQARLAGVQRLSKTRLGIVAAIITVAIACSQIDFERTTVALFVYSELFAFPPPGQGGPASTVAEAVVGAGGLVLREITAATFNWTSLLSATTTALILRSLFVQAPRISALARGRFRPVAILAVSAFVGTVAAIAVHWPAFPLDGGGALPIPQFSLGPLLAILTCLFLRLLQQDPGRLPS